MKAIDLAKLLMEHPEAEVVHQEYMGCDTPQVPINSILFETRGSYSRSRDGGDFIDANGKLTDDVITVFFDSNVHYDT